MNKSFLPYDIYERHRKVASFIPANSSVLDVGGELNHLTQFTKNSKVVVANLNTGDVIIQKNKLPFASNSFEIVCAIDVLEHIPPKDRKKFIESLVQVARSKIIMSFPIGTPMHEAYERQIKNWLKIHGQDVKYLEEHIKYGLPTKETIQDLTKDYDIRVYFSGNIKINKMLFKIFMFDPKITFIRKLIYCLKLIFNFTTNYLFYNLLASTSANNLTNRAYVVINKIK